MNRRNFLASILAAGVAPAAVGSGILMPVRKIVVPRWVGMDLGSGEATAVALLRANAAGTGVEWVSQPWLVDHDTLVAVMRVTDVGRSRLVSASAYLGET